MKQFALIFRHVDVAGKIFPEQWQQWMQQHTNWIAELIKQRSYVSGTGFLFDGSAVVYADGAIEEGAFGTGQETLGGFIIVNADNTQEAIRLAKGSPVLQGAGNSIKIRLIVT